MALPACVARPVAVAHPAGTVLVDARSGLRAEGRPSSSAQPIHQRVVATLRSRAQRLWGHPAREQVVPLAALSVVSTVGTVSAPALLHWPLLLVALSPRLVFLTMAAADVHWLPFLLVATARLCLADPFHHRLGQVCGERTVARLPGPLRRLVQRSAHLQRPLAALAVALRPNGTMLAWAGSQGLSGRLVTVLAVTSSIVYVLAVRAGATALLG